MSCLSRRLFQKLIAQKYDTSTESIQQEYAEMKNKENRKIPAPIVILVHPQLAMNVGMVARAMMNCGLNELRLVCPKQSHISQKAISAASGAQSILEQAQVYNSLSDALSDIQYSFATTARTRDMVKPLYSPQKAALKVKKAKKVKFTLKDANGKAIAGKKITVKVNGKTFSAKTNSKGVATISVKVTKKGKFTATAKFAGDKAYKAITKKAYFTVKK